MRAANTALPLAGACIALFSLGCERPVAGRDGPYVQISGVSIFPRFVRAGVPIDIAFAASAAPASVEYTLGGALFDCRPIARDDGLLHCIDGEGVAPGGVAEGFSTVSIEAKSNNGSTSVATATVTIDFTCPRLSAASVTPSLVKPGDQAIMILETSEPLGEPPAVSRNRRPFGTTVGTGTSFIVVYVATPEDADDAPILVELRDRAGNTSADCQADRELPFVVDKAPPFIVRNRVLVERGAGGAPSRISAEANAFDDDTAVIAVVVTDELDGAELGRFVPEEDASLAPSVLSRRPRGRVLVTAIDKMGQSSDTVHVTERWTLSAGDGTAPKSGVRTSVRLSEPRPGSRFSTNGTFALAPEIAARDPRVAVIDAETGFVASGRLPNAYENAFQIAAGYDRANSAIVAFGGLLPDNNGYDYIDQTLILRWSEDAGAYDVELPAIAQPTERFSTRIAFDSSGCGIMFGGEGLDPDIPFGGVFLDDLWQVCASASQPGSYSWTRLFPVNSGPSRRVAPIAHDPVRNRYLVTAGDAYLGAIAPVFDPANYYYSDEVYFLDRNVAGAWRWTQTSTPAGFVERWNHLAYWDPVMGGFGTGLGRIFPDDLSLHAEDFWVLQDDSWHLTHTPLQLGLFYRQGFGYDYDEARGQLVMWGDNGGQCLPTPCTDPFPLVLILTSTTPRIDERSWRYVNLDPPVPRAWPTLVWDRDREVFVVFGGTRFDSRFVPPDIYSLVMQPAFPFAAVAIDLEAERPAGVASLELELRVRGAGDADGVGSMRAPAEGVVVSVWDQEAADWVVVVDRAVAVNTGLVEVSAMIADRPERFVRADGVVDVLVRAKHPGTEAVAGRLELDFLAGELRLEP